MRKYYEKQLNEGKNGELNELFERWISSYADKDAAKRLFCQDGLVVKYKDESTGYDVNKEWEKAERKIMFILKDCPDKWGYDARTILVGDDNDEKSQKNAWKTRNLKGAFFKRIACLLYGLSILTQENKGVADKFPVINGDKETLIKTFNEVPFAFVEGKKLAGNKECPSGNLSEALERDGAFLKEEISILSPNIIVCCDSNGLIFDNVVKNYFDGIVPDDAHKWEYTYLGFDCKLYYYAEKGVLLFNSFHFSYRCESWKIYERVLDPFRQFFERYKTFDVVNLRKQNIL